MKVEDRQIVDLFWERSETALSETRKKYGRYCYSIAYNILLCEEDAEECVNDAYVKLWNAIPPNRPDRLSSFIGKITRRVSLDRYEKYTAQKRGGGRTELVLDELQECLPASGDRGDMTDDLALRDALNRFLRSLTPENRKIFMCRYWYLRSIKEIAAQYALSESKVKMTLLRTRNSLRLFLEEEGMAI